MPHDPIHDEPRLAAVLRSHLLDTAPEASFDRLAALARELLGTPFAFVTVVDEERSYWKARAGIAPDGPVQNTVDESFCQYVVRSGEPLVLGDVRLDSLTCDNPSIESMNVVAWAGYPVRSPDGHVLGSFCVVDTVVREWTEADRRVLHTLAEVASTEVALRITAVEAQEALAAAQLAQRRVGLLAASGDLLRAGLDMNDLLAAITHVAVPTLGAAAVAVAVDEVGTITARASASHHEDDAEHACLLAAVTRYAVGLETTADLPEGRSTGHTRLPGVTEALVVPLSANGRVVGQLQVLGDGRLPYSDDDLALAQELADRAALALDNALLYAEQRDAALALQHALLSEAPQPDRLEIAVRYKPATRHADVGGDWYDAFVQPDGSTVLAVGDVVGHDLRAAAGMGQLRSMLRVLGYQRPDAPAAVLTDLDDALAGLGVDTIASAVLARLDAEDPALGGRRMHWSNAGHLPPLVLGPDGAVTVLERPADPLLGLDLPDPPERCDHDTVVPSGSIVLIFTDGLVERRDRGLDEGIDELVATLRTLVGVPLEHLCDAVLSAHAKGSTDDDVALLAVRVLGDGVADPVVPQRDPATVEVHDRSEQLVLAADAHAPAHSRRFLRDSACAGHLTPVLDDAALLTTELVTNALRHAHPPVTLELHCDGSDLTVLVRDADRRPPRMRDADPDAEGGRGLLLIETLSQAWGTHATPTGKTVWFRLAIS